MGGPVAPEVNRTAASGSAVDSLGFRLASPTGPYVDMGEEQGGLLVEDGDWLPALEVLLRDPDRRRALAASARRWAEGQTISAGGARWQAVFRDAIECSRGGA